VVAPVVSAAKIRHRARVTHRQQRRPLNLLGNLPTGNLTIGHGVRPINTEPLIAPSTRRSSACVRSVALPVEVAGKILRRGQPPVPTNHRRQQHSRAPASRSLDQQAVRSASIPTPRYAVICSVTASAQME
jgi:hypothetical protein